MTETDLLDKAVPCRDPSCEDPETGERSLAEPDQDGEHKYYVCEVCGMEFGYTQIEQAAATGNCSIGVPETTRRALSGTMEKLMTERDPNKVSLGLTVGKRQD